MNKIFKLIWNNSLGQWIVCSELGRKGKSSSKTALLIGGVLISSASLAVECTKAANGSVTVFNTSVTPINCEVSSIEPVVGNQNVYNYGFYINGKTTNDSITVTKDLTTTLKGAAGILVAGTNPNAFALFDATGKTIDLTIKNLDSNKDKPNGDDVTKDGVAVSHGGTAKIGTLKLNMENLPIGGSFDYQGITYQNLHEHYGVVTGASVKGAEPDTYNGIRSSALFDNLDIKMSADNKSDPYSSFPLVGGIRAIQGAYDGKGSAGYVKVNNDLNIGIANKSNDAIGIYVSGTEKKRCGT